MALQAKQESHKMQAIDQKTLFQELDTKGADAVREDLVFGRVGHYYAPFYRKWLDEHDRRAAEATTKKQLRLSWMTLLVSSGALVFSLASFLVR